MKFGALLSSKGKDYFYIMHLSYNGKRREDLWNYAKAHDIIGLDVPNIVKGDWLDVQETAKKSLGKGWINQFEIFCKRMGRDDIVMVFNGISSILGIARTTETRHHYDRSLSENSVFFDHIRQVYWERAYDYANPLKLHRPLLGFSRTLSKVTQSSPRWPILTDIDI
jgi:hypothetical protein